jgi:hypothetical protein
MPARTCRPDWPGNCANWGCSDRRPASYPQFTTFGCMFPAVRTPFQARIQPLGRAMARIGPSPGVPPYWGESSAIQPNFIRGKALQPRPTSLYQPPRPPDGVASANLVMPPRSGLAASGSVGFRRRVFFGVGMSAVGIVARFRARTFRLRRVWSLTSLRRGRDAQAAAPYGVARKRIDKECQFRADASRAMPGLCRTIPTKGKTGKANLRV